MGSEDRFTYTVIGDVVNVAARLQDISREFPRTPILIPANVVGLIEKEMDVAFQYLNDFSLKGKEKPIATYGILGSTASLSPGFDIFDLAHYTTHDALMACGLYCLDYGEPVIGEALLIPEFKIHQWIATAKENRHYLGQVLIREFKISPENLIRLSPDR